MSHGIGMAVEPVCPAGWHKDIYLSARDSPCVVTTGWLSLAVGLFTVSNGLWFVAQAAIITKLRRHSERWRSFRIGTHVTLMLGALSWSCGAALLWYDLSGELAAPRALWRALFVLGCCMAPCVGLTMALMLLLDPAVRLVGGLDLSRSRQVQLWVKLLAWAWTLSVQIQTAGAGMALYSKVESTQATGTAMVYGGVVAAGVALGLVFLRMGKLLHDVLSGLDSLSSSAKQVVALRKVLRMVGILVPSSAPLMVVIMCVRPLKALSGVLVWFATAAVSLVFSVAFPYYEHNRLGPARSSSFPAPKLTPRGSKILPDSATANADFAITDHVAFISKGLIAVPERHALVRQEQERPEGLTRNGVSLAFMKRFADEFGVGTDTTTAEVCALHVKPITDTVKLSLVAVLQGERAGVRGTTEPWVGAPTHFISYAWSYSFRTLIDIVEHHEEEFSPPMGTTNFYFLDQFSLNQHKFMANEQAAPGAPHLKSLRTPTKSLRSLYPDPLPALHHAGAPRTPRTSLFSRSPRVPCTPDEARPAYMTKEELQDQTIKTLRAQMLKSGHVLMCLWPLAAPAPLKRAWCLFELWTALHNGVKVTMCFGGADAAALYDAVRNGSFDIAKLVGKIRAQDASCMEQEDKDLILGLIEKEMGVEHFNAEMQEKLHKCLQDTVRAAIAIPECRRASTSTGARRSSR